MRGNFELWVRIPSLALLPYTIRATEPHSLYCMVVAGIRQGKKSADSPCRFRKLKE
nr:MAG TPA: hypothetical protein [Caudoviricetes sp.]